MTPFSACHPRRMGWRSWNFFRDKVSQAQIEACSEAMVDRSRHISLLEAGYNYVGLDDNYQACGYKDVDHTGDLGGGVVSEWPAYPGGKPLRSFHNASGYPLMNLTRFPDTRAMTDHAHRLGLKMGWCECAAPAPCFAILTPCCRMYRRRQQLRLR